jgi:hypothetical protein
VGSLLPYKPEEVIGEILGQRAVRGMNPGSTAYRCPFIKVECPKRSTQLPNNPYPVCSIWKGTSRELDPARDLISVCPKRFYAVDFLKDVIHHCWSGTKPTNPQIAREVKMEGFGNVDFVIADVGPGQSINRFLSVELQAIDITGSVFDAYKGIVNNSMLPGRPTYGFNWDNVYKRYITQLIRKGYFHHHWQSKIVAVIQDQIYRRIIDGADFMRTTDVSSPTVNIIFMTYNFVDDPLRPGQYALSLNTVEGTSHANLQQAVLYKEPPSREDFCERIKRSLIR